MERITNLAEAVQLYRQAADAGSHESMYNLAICLAAGNGIEQNQAKADEWFGKAAEGGIP